MSPILFLIMLIAAIIILTVLTLKVKMHPVMVLFLTATGRYVQLHYKLFRLYLGQHWCHDYFRRRDCRRYR